MYNAPGFLLVLNPFIFEVEIGPDTRGTGSE